MTAAPDTWVIGDVQGCHTGLLALLSRPEIRRDARLWFAGDLVNRGPDSRATLELVKSMGGRCTAVLGNHDLHLLAVAAGVRKPAAGDTLDDVLGDGHGDELVDWLRHRPLAHYEAGHLLVHAGVPASWGVAKTLALAAEVETALRSPDWKNRLQDMYGNKPAYWRDDLRPRKRLRVIVNALTRMRMCTPDGHMDFSHKGPPQPGQGLLPWFDVPGRVLRDEKATVLFGHWSTLGLLIRPDVIGLDTGCVWGGRLTALRLRDRKLVQVDCPRQQEPGGD